MSSLTYVRGYLVRLLIITGCLSALISWYFVSPQADTAFTELNIMNMNISLFTLFVGIITISARYIRTIKAREKYWPYQLYAMVLMILWVIMGTTVGLFSDFYQTAYLSTKITLHIAILGQIVFFMASGAYRVFRIRNLRTAIFAIGAATLCALNAPWIAIPFPQLDPFREWLLSHPGMAPGRGIMIAGAIGACALGIRVFLGLEKGALRVTEAA